MLWFAVAVWCVMVLCCNMLRFCHNIQLQCPVTGAIALQYVMLQYRATNVPVLQCVMLQYCATILCCNVSFSNVL